MHFVHKFRLAYPPTPLGLPTIFVVLLGSTDFKMVCLMVENLVEINVSNSLKLNSLP